MKNKIHMEDTTNNVLYDHIMKANNCELNDDRLVSLQRKINELSDEYNRVFEEIYAWMDGSFFKISRENETSIISYVQLKDYMFDGVDVTLHISGYSVDTDNPSKCLGEHDVFDGFIIKSHIDEFKKCEVVQIEREDFFDVFKKLNHECVEKDLYEKILNL